MSFAAVTLDATKRHTVVHLQVMQRFADCVRVQSLVQSERSLCYDVLLHALEVRCADSVVMQDNVP